MIYYDIHKSSFGRNTLIAHTDKGICAILFGIDPEHELEKLFTKESLTITYSPQYALKIINQLENNINLQTIPIDIKCGTKFQQLVWQQLYKIPEGSTITYSELAAQIGMPTSVRAVASAVGKNPISILIPCHRIIPKSDGIGKYRWGSDLKQLLLNREQDVKLQ